MRKKKKKHLQKRSQSVKLPTLDQQSSSDASPPSPPSKSKPFFYSFQSTFSVSTSLYEVHVCRPHHAFNHWAVHCFERSAVVRRITYKYVLQYVMFLNVFVIMGHTWHWEYSNN